MIMAHTHDLASPAHLSDLISHSPLSLTVPGSNHLSSHLRTVALAVPSAWNVSHLSPFTLFFFDLCMFLSF